MTCFYIHWDGYPQGAAEYFWNIHKVKNHRGDYADRFMRGNKWAEFTLSHQAHSDTEYRYKLDKNGNLTAWNDHNINNVWKIVYQGSGYNFVNQYRDSSEKLYLFTHKFSKIEWVMTLSEALIYVREKMLDSKIALSKEHMGNAKYAENEYQHCCNFK